MWKGVAAHPPDSDRESGRGGATERNPMGNYRGEIGVGKADFLGFSSPFFPVFFLASSLTLALPLP